MSDEPARPDQDDPAPAGGGARRIGSYEMRERLGVGGMGEVYLARDAKLERDVAIKLLRNPSRGDSRPLEQFQREAKLLAALSHPNIAAIYGIEEQRGVAGESGGLALVLELVAGETLAERIKRGPLPLEEALTIARQVADALEAAHQTGIIHCDLKPANIKIRPDGTVKVLDFGLAKFARPADSSRALAETTTISTSAGDIVGTPFYMSPEQARGQAVDSRADIWAFGCVLYEMLSGERPFTGGTVTDVLGAVVGAEPDLSRVPARVRPLLARCFAKDARRRLRHIGDAMILIEAASAGAAEPSRSTSAPRARLPWFLALAALSVAAIMGLWRGSRDGEGQGPAHLQITLPDADRLMAWMSPDGRSLLVRVANQTGARLVVRSLETGEVRELPGTSESGHACWSPDGRSIAFESRGALKKIGASGGAPETLVDHGVNQANCWGNGHIVVMVPEGGLSMVPENGGGLTPLTTADRARGEIHHEAAACLPDGRFLYFRHLQERGASGIYLGVPSLTPDKQSASPVLVADDGPVFVPAGGGAPDEMLFMKGDVLYAQRISTSRAELLGEPRKIAERVASTGGSVEFTAAARGPLIYRRAEDPNRQLTFFDRAGKVTGTVGDPNPALRGLRIAPDGKRAALAQFPPDRRINNDDIWIVPFGQSPQTRVTSELSSEATPVWSADGSRIAYGSTVSGPWAIYEKTLDSMVARLLSLPFPDRPALTDWSPDGRFLVMTVNSTPSRNDILVLPLKSGGEGPPWAATPLVQTPFNERGAVFSPDGRSIAYLSDETGRQEVYVRDFRVSADGTPTSPESSRRRISNGALGFVRWNHNGRELLYLSAEGAIVSVELSGSIATSGASSRELWSLPREAIQAPNLLMDMTPDGSRFLVAMPPREALNHQLEVLLNWR